MDSDGDHPGPVPSILDRLIDGEHEIGRPDLAGAAIDALRRDLEWLLNSRREVTDDAAADRLAAGIVDWGLPDLCEIDLARDADRQRLARWITAALIAFEPRLLNVVVVPDPDADRPGRTRLRIEASLDIAPAPRALAFDTLISWPDRHIALHEAPP